MTITELAIKRPILIIVLFASLALLGIFSYSQLKYEMFPKLDIPIITISTSYPGASASEVETSVTKVLEDAVSNLDKVDSLVSTSAEGVSVITISLTQDANIDFSVQDTQRKVNQVLWQLPTGAKPPAISKIDLDSMAIMTIGATSNLTDTDFYQFVTNTLSPRLSRLAGVGQITIMGGQQREIRVNIDTQKLRSYNLSTLQVLQAIKNANLDFPTGTVKDIDNEYVVRLAGKFISLDDMRELIVGKSLTGGYIQLSDVAEVQDGVVDPTIIARINGKDTLSLAIQKQSDANSVDVSRRVRRELGQMEKEYQNIKLHAKVVVDTTNFTIEAANAVKTDLGMAILLVAGVMLLFLHSYRNSIIVMLAIPTSLVTTLIGIWALGYTLNIITLLALSLVIGILVDDAIVVLENIYRHLEMGEDSKIAAMKGRNEIGFTALSITMVDVVVYGPLAMTTGIVGGIMREFSLVIVISTLTSLFVSFTVTPLLASRFSRVEALMKGTLMGRFGIWFEKLYEDITQEYLKILRWSLNNTGKILLIATILFIFALSLLPLGFIGTEFMPTSDQDQILISLELPPGSELEQTNFVTQRIEKIVSKIPEVDTIFNSVGINSSQSTGDNYATITVMLVPKNERSRSTFDILDLIKTRVGHVPGVKIYINMPSGGGGGQAVIQYAITGPSYQIVADIAERLRKIVAKIQGTSDVRLSSENGNPEMRIQIDRKKMAAFGLSMADVGSTLQVGLSGNTDAQYEDVDGNEYNIDVQLDQFDRTRTSDIGNLTITNPSGKLVALNQFADILPSTGPTRLERRDRNYAVTILSDAIGRTSGSIGADILKAIAKEKLPPGVAVAPVGSLKSMGDSFSSLGLAFLAAIIFVYLIMVALYNSFIYPFSILFSIPLAIIGSLLALGLTQNSLAIFSIMGIIMLVGLVSKNAILLVDFTNKAREEGASVKEALMIAGRERLRPILMTTMTMILGMMPLALGNSSGSEWKRGLGWALIGGLSSSMLMTLVVVPVVYTKIEHLRESFVSIGQRLTRKKTI